MLTHMARLACVLGTVILTGSPAAVSAGWLPGFNSCNCARPARVARSYYQPVAQACYQTVPVTEYQQVRHTVRRPVVETKYVEQPVTEYRQVMEAKTVDVPTVSYQDVTEYQTRTCDQGRWITRYECRPRTTACAYDNRAGLNGLLNRTGFRIRSAFTPRMTSRREYVPNVVAQTVPVTRRVAIRGTKKVTYNVARMVPYTTTRKVAVNTVRYVNAEVVALRPVTVMRTVPIGSRTAYAYSPYLPIATQAPQTALQPNPDPVSAKAAGKSPKRTANAHGKFDDGVDVFAPKKNDADGKGTGNDKKSGSSETPATESSFIRPPRRNSSDSEYSTNRRANYRLPEAGEQPLVSSHRVPSIIRVSGWKARNRNSSGPVLNSSKISLAGNTR